MTDPRRWRPSTLSLVALALAVALLAVGWVQARQFSLLRDAVRHNDEFSVIAVYQAESEYLRLREAWRASADERLPLEAEALRLRYDIWVSRIQLLLEGRGRRLLQGDAQAQAEVAQVQAFIAAADQVLGPVLPGQDHAAGGPLTREFVQSWLPRLEALAHAVQGLSLQATHTLARNVEERTFTIQQQSLLGLVLTGSLTVLTLGFALLALRQLSQLRQRRLALEEATHHLQQARKEAVAASEAKSAFLANMSHEIRTPFHGLMGMLSLLRETGLAPRQMQLLRTATESADHLLALLNDILDMSQLETGRLTLNPAPVDLRAMLRDVEALMRPQAAAKDLALHLDTAPDVPERVICDATRVRQIIFNLLSNALKFSDRGAVALDLHVRSGDNGRPELEFQVTDTGIGMDEVTLSQLFRRFMQGDGTRARRHGGSGLGLEISRNLARLMHGDITVRSKPGEGSCFTFRMPLVHAQGHATPAAPRTALAAAADRPLRVLVAEDHAVNRQYMAALLDSMGHEARFANDGQEALAEAREQGFDLVLMDLHMPLMDGIAAARAIRSLPHPQRSTVPIIALTADAFDETRERCVVAGMNDFLTKPVSPQALASAMRRLFGTSGRTSGTDSRPAVAPTPAPAGPALPAASRPGGGAAAVAEGLHGRPAPAASAGSAGPNPPLAGRGGAAGDAMVTGLPGGSLLCGGDQGPARPGPGVGATVPQVPSRAGGAGETGAGASAHRAAAEPGPQPVLDDHAIRLALQALSRAQFSALLQAYLDQAPHTIERLRAAVRDAQPLEVRVNAHAAKGAALNLGLAGLAATAEALQRGAEHLPAHEVARLVQRFEELVPDTTAALRERDLLPLPAPTLSR